MQQDVIDLMDKAPGSSRIPCFEPLVCLFSQDDLVLLTIREKLRLCLKPIVKLPDAAPYPIALPIDDKWIILDFVEEPECVDPLIRGQADLLAESHPHLLKLCV